MKLRVNDLFDVELKDGEWVTEIGHTIFRDIRPLEKVLDRFSYIAKQYRLMITYGGTTFKAHLRPQLSVDCEALVVKAIEDGAEHLDLSLRVGDKVKLLHDDHGICHELKLGAIGTITEDRDTLYQVKFGTALVNVSSMFGSSVLEKL